MNVRLMSFMGAASLTLGIAACGGGGGGSTPAVPTPQSTSATSSISGSGGTLSLSLPNGGTASLTVPANALAQPATITLVAYTSAAALPKTFASVKRHPESIPTGSTFLVGFSVDTGGATLYKPMQITETAAAAPSGTVLRLAMYDASVSAFTDVDTATATGANVTNDLNKAYVGISTSGSAIPYAFYAVPAASAAAPSPISFSLSPAGPYTAGSTVSIAGNGADANGNRYAFTPAITADANLGTFTQASAAPFAGTLVAAATNAGGNITVTDPSRAISTKVPVKITTSRPIDNGDAYTYAGTLAQTISRTLPSPQPTSSSSATISQTVAVSSGKTFNGQSGLFDFHTVENDTYPLQVKTNTTDSYFNLSGSNFVQYGSTLVDNTNPAYADTLTYNYTAPLIIDQLPEVSGASWSNTPAGTISQTLADGSAFLRTYASNGTYTENATYSTGGKGTITENADGSGSYVAPFFGGGLASVAYSAPAPKITVTLSGPGVGPTPQTLAITAWYPLPLALYTESDKNAGSVALPAACNVPASIGATANQLVQTINRVDTILGYTETTTTNSYVIGGFGMACLQMNDVVTSYYDFQGDTPFSVYFTGTAPYQVTTTTQTLGLQSATVFTASGARRVQSAPIAGAIAMASTSRFMQVIERDRARRMEAFGRMIQNRLVQKGAAQ